MKYRKDERGFTFVESLVAIVVLSIGLLGLAGLQTISQRANHSAYLRSQATLFAYDMSDRMRANRSGRLAGAYDAIAGIPADPGCISAGCSAANIAQHDAFEWNTALAAQLPSGQGTVVNNGGVFTITVMWDDERTGAAGTACGGDPAVDLTCFSVNFQP